MLCNTERNAEASTGGPAAEAERDQEVDEVDSRAPRGEQSAQGRTDCVAATQPGSRPH